MASISDVSTRPAWASPPSIAGRQHVTGRPSARSLVVARASGSALPPCQDSSTTAAKSSALRTSSTTTASSAAWPSDNVPGNPACSPLEPYGSAGATTTSRRPAAAASAIAPAISVSVSSGRCGPCCSVAPRGTTSTGRGLLSRSGQAQEPSLTRPDRGS